MKSMTGYGNARAQGRSFHVSVEIQSYNNRYLEVKTRLPTDYQLLEKDVVKEVSSRLSRGRINVIVSLQQGSERAAVKIDQVLAEKYWQSLKKLWRRLKVSSGLEPSVLLGLPGVIRVSTGQPSAREFRECCLSALNAALQRLEQMREKEGAKMRAFLIKHLGMIKALLGQVMERISRRHFAKAAEAPLAPEPAARPSIEEELARLESHIEQFEEAIGSKAPAGKVLEFVALEMLRETTTLGDKTDDAWVSGKAVVMKSEIENLREQIRNLE